MLCSILKLLDMPVCWLLEDNLARGLTSEAPATPSVTLLSRHALRAELKSAITLRIVKTEWFNMSILSDLIGSIKFLGFDLILKIEYFHPFLIIFS